MCCSAPVQSGSVSPAVQIAPHVPYHTKHLPKGNDDPGKIPGGFAKEKKTFVHSRWLKKIPEGMSAVL